MCLRPVEECTLSEHSPAPASLVGVRVLIVEDEPLLAVELVDELQEQGGIALGPAMSVDEALAVVADELFDAAILNVDLRGRRSGPVAKALSDRKIPFLFVTGNDRFVKEHFPDVPVCPEPYDMPKIVALALLLTPPELSGNFNPEA